MDAEMNVCVTRKSNYIEFESTRSGGGLKLGSSKPN